MEKLNIEKIDLNLVKDPIDDSFIQLTEKVIDNTNFVSYNNLNYNEKQIYDELLKNIYSKKE